MDFDIECVRMCLGNNSRHMPYMQHMPYSWRLFYCGRCARWDPAMFRLKEEQDYRQRVAAFRQPCQMPNQFWGTTARLTIFIVAGVGVAYLGAQLRKELM